MKTSEQLIQESEDRAREDERLRWERAKEMRMREAEAAEIEESNINLLDTFASAARLNNTVASWIYSEVGADLTYKKEDGYSPYDINPATGKRYIDGYESQAERFKDDRSWKQTMDRIKQIDREQQDRKVIADSGWVGMAANMAFTFADLPTMAAMLVPVKGQGFAAARIAQSVGIGVATASTQEAALYATQETRTQDEMVRNVIAGAVLDTALSVGFNVAHRGMYALARAETSAQIKLAQQEATGEVIPASPFVGPLGKAAIPDTSDISEEIVRSASAAEVVGMGPQVAKTGASGEELKRVTTEFTPLEKVALTLAKATPNGRLWSSKNAITRHLIQSISQLDVEVRGDDMPLSFETEMKEGMKRVEFYILKARRAQKESGLDEMDFSIELDKTLRRGDVSENPVVERMAKTLRAEVIDPLWEAAYQAGIPGTYREVMDDNGNIVREKIQSQTAESYFGRQYDVNMVIEHKDAFKVAYKEAIEDAHARDTVEYNSKVDAFDAEYNLEGLKDQRAVLRNELRNAKKRKNPDTEAISDMELRVKELSTEIDKVKQLRKALDHNYKPKDIPDPEDYIEWEAKLENIWSNVVNKKVGGAVDGTGGTSGADPFKRRAPVLDAFLTGEMGSGGINFMTRNYEQVLSGYAHRMVPKIASARVFGSDDLTWETAFKQLQDDYQSRAEDARVNGDTKLAKKLEKTMERELRDLRAVRDILMGQYLPPGSVRPENKWALGLIRGIRSLNASRMLGSVVVSSMPETSRVMAYDGLSNMTEAAVQVGKKMRIMNTLEGMEEADMVDFILASELLSMGRIQQLTDADFDMAYHTLFDRSMAKVNEVAMTASGMKHYNAYMKGIVASMTQNKIIRTLKAGDPAELQKLKRLGISDEVVGSISRQLNKHAGKTGKLWTANTQLWDDLEARNIFEGAMLKESDKIIISPGAGDKPLWMNTELGKTFGQFKTFIMAATNKMMIPLMQDQEMARKWSEIATMQALGVLTYYAKSYLGGREPSDDPYTVTLEALDQTGLTAYTMEMVNIASKIYGKDILGREQGAIRYNSRSVADSVFGASFGTFNDLAKGGYYIFRDDETAAQEAQTADALTHLGRRLMPLNSNVGLRVPLTRLERYIAEMFGGTGRYATRSKEGASRSIDPPWMNTED